MIKYLYIILFVVFLTPIYGYVGPGLGGGLIATVLGIIVAIFLAIFGVLFYPIKRLIKNIKSRKN
jgi:hypothetical protein